MEGLTLWLKIKKGDTKALEEVHSRYFHMMCLYAFKSINDHQSVEHIVSDCFIKIWEDRGNIDINTSIKSYLFQMLRYRIIDFYRRRRDLLEFSEELPDVAKDDDFDEQQRYAKLYRAITQLPLKQRQVLELAVFDSLTYQEIANKLQISKHTVKNHIRFAYRQLRETLEPNDFNLTVSSKKKWKMFIFL